MKKLFCLLLAAAMLISAAMAEAGLTNFTTTDTDGNTVTQEIFADYDLTVVNVWTTWCGYCLQEMPELARLKTMLPDNVNFITLCEDASTDPELVDEILRASGANFQTLVGNQEIDDQFLYNVYSIPTTFFLDSEGVSVIQPLVGVPSLTDAADAYYTITMTVLSMMEDQE